LSRSWPGTSCPEGAVGGVRLVLRGATLRTERAADEADALGLPPTAVAKALVLTASEGHLRVVLPASARIALGKVRDYVEDGKRVHLAGEDELARDYPEFELGAVPPFGGASGDRVLVDSRVAEQASVVLEMDSHEQSVQLQTAGLLELTEARSSTSTRRRNEREGR
jgi:Ala-tRNA(Pro) deacylase